MSKFDNQYMQRALELALLAKKADDIPVGAVIFDPHSKQIIGEGYNTGNISHDPTLHAEIVAIRNACATKKSKILKGCYIYVTLEPCAMCATAISYAQIQRLYYGAYDSKFGAVDSNIKIYHSDLSLHRPEVYGGILKNESASLLQEYFKSKRIK